MKICPRCKNKQDEKWQFCHKCLLNLYSEESINLISPPSWVGLQKSLLNKHGAKMDPKGEKKLQDIIEIEKIKELKSDPRARSWEEGRKREWKNNKKYYLKNGGKF